MRIFLFESVNGGGFLGKPDPAASLRTEGAAMLSAVADDFARLPDIQVATILDARSPLSLPRLECVTLTDADDFSRQFELQVKLADWCLVIAPEIEGELVRYVRQVETLGGRRLGPDSNWTELAADKHQTCRKLAKARVPAVDGIQLPEGARLPLDFPYPAILKRRDGTGACDSVQIDSPAAAEAYPPLAFAARYEPLLPGRSASVALLLGSADAFPLAPCWQQIADDGTFAYLGGEVIENTEIAKRATRLAERAVAALGPAVGYVGVDLLLGEHESEDMVLEINPRLTTSYVGLRAAYSTNLAAALLAVVQGDRPELSSPKPVAFRPDGTVFHREAATA